MIRFITWSLVAVALAALATPSAYADVDVSLNIVFNDFLDPSQGGSWSLVAKTDTPDSDGIVSLVSRFGLGTIPAAGTVNPNIGHDIGGGNLIIGTFPGFVEFLYGQNPDPNSPIPGLVLGVGLPGGPSDLGLDFLGDPTWDNASEIAFGTIPDLTIIPDFLTAAANEVFETIGGGIVQANIGETVVRFVPEPSAALLGLLACIDCGCRRRRRKL
jgi:hypothetical protein